MIGKEKRFKASKPLRGAIEEAQVAVENLAADSGLDWPLLAGKWRLLYTTASDVVPILESETRLSLPLLGVPPVRVGNIYQEFSAVDDEGVGRISNIIELGVPYLLAEKKGVTITVQARYEIRSPHRITLWFEEARLEHLRISEGFESLLAPALLPRGILQQNLLLFLRELQIRIPFGTLRQNAFRATGGTSQNPYAAGGSYQLMYLDEDMLIGRATTQGGSFVFARDENKEAS